jgi:hypothetical protein
MAVESPVQQGAATKTFPYALLRAGFPYYTTLGMRRVTTAAADVAIGGEGRFYAICRDDGQGGLIRRSNWPGPLPRSPNVEMNCPSFVSFWTRWFWVSTT